MESVATTTKRRSLFRGGTDVVSSTLAPLAENIGTAFRRVRAKAFSTLIVALYVVGGLGDVNAQTPAWDLSGRWTSQRHGYVLDVTRCGAEWCGIKLNADQSCGALALHLALGLAAGEQRGLIGTLNLEPIVQTYKVSATVAPFGATRPTELRLLGNPNMPPQPMSRMIPFQDSLVRGPEATCRTDGKLS